MRSLKARRYRRVAVGVVVCCGIVVGISALAFGAFQPVDQQQRISTTGGNQDGRQAIDTQVAYDPERKEYLAVWQSDAQVDGAYEIWGQRLSLTGAKIGSRFKISNAGAAADPNNPKDARDALTPAVAYNPVTQVYLVVWSADEGTRNNDNEIWGRQINAVTGAPLDADFRISYAGVAALDVTDYRDANAPEVAYNSTDQQFMIVWRADEGSTNQKFEIWGSVLDSNGNYVSGDFQISNTGTPTDPSTGVPDSTYKPGLDVAYNSQAAQYLVAWSGNPVAPVGGNAKFEIYGQRLSPVGAEVGIDFRISQTGQDTDAMRDATSVNLAYNSHANEYLAVFNADRSTSGTVETPDANEEEVYGQRISATGLEVGTNDFRISKAGPEGNRSFDTNGPQVASGNPANEYLVAWTQGVGNAAQQSHIFGQRLGANASKVGSNFQISRLEGIHLFPDIARSVSAKEYMTVWEGSTLGVKDYEIYGRRIGQSASCGGKLATRQGTSQPDTVKGASGADVIATLGGKDTAKGGGGNDLICGGGGRDHLIGGAGSHDKCIGGPGTDSFVGCETKVQ